MAEAAEAPKQQEMGVLEGAPDLTALIGSADKLFIHQKVGLLEGVTQGCFEQKNEYKILDQNEQLIMQAKENSSCCTRMICAPNHSTMIYIEKPNGETLLSIERKGNQCCACPQKCLGCCCILTDCCKDGITVYPGKVEGDAGYLENAPTPISMLKQPVCGGGMWPKLDTYPKGDPSAEISHRFSGPCCFGGCSELCVTSTYKYQTVGGEDVGEIVHLTPKTCEDVCKEMCTDVDKFSVSFDQKATITDRATVLSGAFLIDYMFFGIIFISPHNFLRLKHTSEFSAGSKKIFIQKFDIILNLFLFFF